MIDPSTQPEISPMTLDDYEDAARLWGAAEGVCLGAEDSPESIARYLARNPGLSLVARAGGRLVGAVLCGHDGRRAVMYHLAVDEAWRRRGLARELVRRCLAGLEAEGITSCLIRVLPDNEPGRRFWETMGWKYADRALTMLRERPCGC